MKNDIFSCESPLLLKPAENIARTNVDFIPPPQTHGEKRTLDAIETKQNAFMVCLLTRLVNEASLCHQSKNCQIPKDTHVALDFWSNEMAQTQ